MHWLTTRFDLDLAQPLVMGIVNLTPDSFSDGGAHAQTASALQYAQHLLQEGAHILDVGGESTRPGAQAVSPEQEWQRIAPFLQEAVHWQVPISVDTYHAQTMHKVLDMGVDIINDIWALRQPGALQAVASHPRCGVCLMHMHRDPQTMQVAPMQGQVTPQVQAFLTEQTERLLSLGVTPGRVVWDPGIGFGKTVAQNFELLRQQSSFLSSGFPILAGWSRKSALGQVLADTLGAEVLPRERVHASVVAAVLAVAQGARVVRVHDVAATVQGLAVWNALQA